LKDRRVLLVSYDSGVSWAYNPKILALNIKKWRSNEFFSEKRHFCRIFIYDHFLKRHL